MISSRLFSRQDAKAQSLGNLYKAKTIKPILRTWRLCAFAGEYSFRIRILSRQVAKAQSLGNLYKVKTINLFSELGALCAPSTRLRTCFARVMIFPVSPIQKRPRRRQSKIQNQRMGRVKANVEPFPTSLSTQILPPCSSTNFLANVNPRPVPSLLCA